jgi:hypothetical protein
MSLIQKNVQLNLTSHIPLRVVDDQGRLIGSAYLCGQLEATLLVGKNTPEGFNLEVDVSRVKLKLDAHIEDNVVDGVITLGG